MYKDQCVYYAKKEDVLSEVTINFKILPLGKINYT
jgi:hypothetical protein